MSSTPSNLANAVAPNVVMGADVNNPNGPDVGQAPTQTPTLAPQPSRLLTILGAIAKVGETAMSGIPDRGRPSFVTGLGEGARAEQSAQATQQAIRFKSFDDQVRLSQLHAQDLKMQNDNQAQQDAHTAAELHMRSMANDLGLQYDTIANHGPAVMDHLTAQTAANGAASVPAGTHISADGDNIYMPSNPDSSQTQDAQKQLYIKLAPSLGLPSLPNGASFVPPKLMNMLTNKTNGFALDGSPIQHGDLPSLIATTQAQRDNLAKNGGSPDQLKTLDNLTGIYKANLNALDAHDASVADAASKRKQAEAKAGIDEKGAQTRETNDAKPQKADTNLYIGTDPSGNQVAGTTDQMKGLSGVIKADSDTGKKIVAARELISPDGLFNSISQQVKTLSASGKLGGVGQARLNDVMLHKVGSDPDFVPLADNLALLSTKLMQVHVGNKGSNEMMDHFKALADAGKMDLPTLVGGLKTEYQYVHGMARLPKTQQQNGGAQ